jgi:hypothetical protein
MGDENEKFIRRSYKLIVKEAGVMKQRRMDRAAIEGVELEEGVSDLLIWHPLLKAECYQFCMGVS